MRLLINLKLLLETEKARLPLFYPVFLGIGIIQGVFFPFSCYQKLIVYMISSIVLCLTIRKNRGFVIAIMFETIGVLVSQTGGILKTDLMVNKQYLQDNVPKISFHANVGFIEETHPTMKGMQRVIFKNVTFHKENSNLHFIKIIKMTCGSKMLKDIKPMDNVDVFGSLTKFKDPVIPGSFDQLQYNTIVGIDANGVVFSLKKSKQYESNDFMEVFSSIRFSLTKAISQKIKGEASGICAALLTGDKSAIKTEIRDGFIKSGIAHILAISGLHMSLVAGILFFLFRRLFLYLSIFYTKINSNKIASIITIPFTFLYLALSGFSPSATRAFFMTTIFLISQARGKKAISLKNISIAALLILLFSPFSLFHLSFQLSFAAVVALISFYEKFQGNLFNLKTNKFLKYLYFSIITTIIATAATAPISIATFNRFSLQNVLGNLIAIPITSFLIAPLGIINIVTANFADVFLLPLEFSVNLIIKVALYISSLPGSNIALKTPDMFVYYTSIVGGILLCLLKTKLRHIGSIISLLCLCHYMFIQKTPVYIAVPGEKGIFCFIKEGKIYANSKQKGRNKIKAIAKNLGLENENINKTESIPTEIRNRNYAQKSGLFIWTNGKTKILSTRKHPVCPVTFS